jgi:hypothetical protein
LGGVLEGVAEGVAEGIGEGRKGVDHNRMFALILQKNEL